LSLFDALTRKISAMPHLPSTTGSAPQPRRRKALWGKVLRYAAGSGVATVCSETTFVLLYGALHATPAVASVVAWVAGAVPNYWLNRSWTWRRRGRPSLTREVLPYLGIILVTLLVAVVATSSVDDMVSGGPVAARVRVVAVGGTYLAVYGVMFLLRFFLLDSLFRRAGAKPRTSQPDPVPVSSRYE
jgi:putative flippase GtrA